MANKAIGTVIIDLNVFEMAFHDYYPALVSYGSSMLKDRDEAEDVVQQVFVSVWERKNELQVHSSLRSMLYTMVYNACLNRLKHFRVRAAHAGEVMSTETDAISGHQHTEQLEQHIEIAINTLPEQCARIFRMRRYDELSGQEIANQLGISIKTVENQMGKALRLMRTQLQEYLPAYIYLLSTILY